MTWHNRRSVSLLLVLSTLSSGSCAFETVEEEDLRGSIQAMLTETVDAWNRGDLDAFLESYATGPSTVRVFQSGPVTGMEAIRSGYVAHFDGSQPRDSLQFEDLTVRTFPPLVAVATLRYVMKSGDEIRPLGWATLVLRRTGEGWRIVHDHSP